MLKGQQGLQDSKDGRGRLSSLLSLLSLRSFYWQVAKASVSKIGRNRRS